MALSTVNSANRVQQWALKHFREYVRKEVFADHTGEDANNVFQVVKDLTKKAGDRITVSGVMRITGDGIAGDNNLEGNETQLSAYGDQVEVDQLRQAVARADHEQSKTVIDILEEGEVALEDWQMDQMRTLKINRMAAPTSDGVTTHADAAEADKDSHLSANSDRFQFGALISNHSSLDYSTSMGNVDTTNDKLTMSFLRLVKRRAKLADPHIAPLRVDKYGEWFICYAGSNPCRDLDSDMDTVHQNAAPRSMRDNPIFTDGDRQINGILVREIPEMTSLGSVGATSAPVYQAAFCGRQAVVVAWAKLTRGITNNGRQGTDYGNIQGVGIAETRGAKKYILNSKQNGIVDGRVAAAADA